MARRSPRRAPPGAKWRLRLKRDRPRRHDHPERDLPSGLPGTCSPLAPGRLGGAGRRLLPCLARTSRLRLPGHLLGEPQHHLASLRIEHAPETPQLFPGGVARPGVGARRRLIGSCPSMYRHLPLPTASALRHGDCRRRRAGTNHADHLRRHSPTPLERKIPYTILRLQTIHLRPRATPGQQRRSWGFPGPNRPFGNDPAPAGSREAQRKSPCSRCAQDAYPEARADLLVVE